MVDIQLLSGGAAQGLVAKLTPEFQRRTARGISGEFGAIGAMRKLLEAGHTADVVIFSRSMIEDLARVGTVDGATMIDIGVVATAIAVKQGSRHPAISNADELTAAIGAADAVYFPDPALATAGIHFNAVMDQLGLSNLLATRLRPYPNGRTAMAAMAAGSDGNPIGCTQETEIRSTPGVTLVGPLPPGLELETMYTAAVTTRSPFAADATVLIDVLAGGATAEVRLASGFRA